MFPLRFETPGPVAGSLAGLFVHDLPDDELARYRGAIEAVTAEDVQRVAREHIRPDEAAIVLVGDHDAVRHGARGAGARTDRGHPRSRARAGPPPAMPTSWPGPVDSGEGGPAEGAEDPDLPGSDEPADPGTDDEHRRTRQHRLTRPSSGPHALRPR